MAYVAAIAGAVAQKKAYNIRSAGDKAQREQGRLGAYDQEQRRTRMFQDIQDTANTYGGTTRQAAIDKAVADQQAGMDRDLSGATRAQTDTGESADTLAYRARQTASEGQRMADIVRKLSQIQGPQDFNRDQAMSMADLQSRLASQIASARAMGRAYNQARSDTVARANKDAAWREALGQMLMSYGMSGGGSSGGGTGGSSGFNLSDYNNWAERNN